MDEMLAFPARSYSFSGTDERDFHVHALAVHSEANYILTSNRVHNFTMLPEQEKYQVIHPDDFLLALAHLDAKGFADARREQPCTCG